ncbi:uncharacterized protein LOC142767562 [Rhipicephalus microplus]|uniref:uncharacterized protein LOC142767562 n=1 Tax=Rhipicephalus microplus TaxID=6941 RepID=UPI003F6B3371
MRECIAVEKVAAIGLFKLCSVAEDRVVASVFGVGRSTVNGIYKEFCEAIASVLESDWIKMLSPSETAQHIWEFMAVSDFPQAVGALDTATSQFRCHKNMPLITITTRGGTALFSWRL